MKFLVFLLFLLLLPVSGPVRAAPFPTDRIPTAKGDLVITFIGHGTLMFSWQGKVVHVDPWSKLADYSALPKADLVLITHEHQDHLDPTAAEAVSKPGTVLALNPGSSTRLPRGVVLRNGETRTLAGLGVQAVPAYNLVHKRDDGNPFHPKGTGNGYVIEFGDKRVYVAGDTEDIPEMRGLGRIDGAFLPVNLPYTMTPEMVLSAARMIKSAVLYPYHTGETDMDRVQGLLRGLPGTEMRVFPMR